jgi:hypothetical protein
MNAMHNRKLTIADLRPKAAASAPPPPRDVKKAKGKKEGRQPQPAPPPPTPKVDPPPLPPDPSVAERIARSKAKQDRRLAKHGITLAEINAVTVELTTRWPELFNVQHRRSLALGIHNAILAELECNPFALGEALKRWTTHPGYLKRMGGGASHRHNLDGSRSSELSPEDKAKALNAYETMTKRWLERKQRDALAHKVEQAT